MWGINAGLCMSHCWCRLSPLNEGVCALRTCVSVATGTKLTSAFKCDCVCFSLVYTLYLCVFSWITSLIFAALKYHLSLPRQKSCLYIHKILIILRTLQWFALKQLFQAGPAFLLFIVIISPHSITQFYLHANNYFARMSKRVKMFFTEL